MQLFWGTLAVMLSVVFFCLLLLNERNPKSTMWKSDLLVGGILVPLIAGAGLIGGLFVIHYALAFNMSNFSWKAPAMAAATVVLGVLVLKLMRIKKRLSRYRAMTEAGGATIHTIEKPAIMPEPTVAGPRAA